jgi:hypothetical protein
MNTPNLTRRDFSKKIALTGIGIAGAASMTAAIIIADPYTDIAANAKYAISWQLKERVFVNDTQLDTDYSKIRDIIIQCGYKGYLPIETLGEGDPVLKVKTLYNKVTTILNS